MDKPTEIEKENNDESTEFCAELMSSSLAPVRTPQRKGQSAETGREKMTAKEFLKLQRDKWTDLTGYKFAGKPTIDDQACAFAEAYALHLSREPEKLGNPSPVAESSLSSPALCKYNVNPDDRECLPKTPCPECGKKHVVEIDLATNSWKVREDYRPPLTDEILRSMAEKTARRVGLCFGSEQYEKESDLVQATDAVFRALVRVRDSSHHIGILVESSSKEK